MSTHFKQFVRSINDRIISSEGVLNSSDRFIVFGAGSSGKDLKKYLEKRKKDVAYFCDNDPQKQGTIIDSIKVIKPEELKRHKNYPICIASEWGKEIALQIKKMGVENYFDITSAVEGYSYSLEPILDHLDELETVYNLIEDEKSKITYMSIIEHRLTLDPASIDVSPYEQYHHPIVKPEAGDVIVDAGAWIGDTAETWETANETLDWWLKHKEYQIYLTPIYVYPGSPLFHTAVEGGVIKDKLRYIEIGCPPMNLTKMNDSQYGKLLVILDEYVQEYRIPGDVVVCEKSGIDRNRGQLFFIRVKCPHCNNIVEYNNLIQNSLYFFKLACRKCNHRFDLPPFDGSKSYEKIKDRISFINSRILNKRAGIWGGGVHTRMLLSSNMFSKNSILCIFDNNSAKHGMHVEGIEIIPFSKDAKLVKKQVDAIIISSIDSEEDIYKQINYLEDYGIKVYKLYN